MSVFNEERVIRAKIEQLVEMASLYGPARIYIYADGSQDETVPVIRKFQDKVTLVTSDQRQGKTAGLNQLVELVDAELIVFTDANVLAPPDALIRLAGHFSDPGVGVAGATLVYSNATESAMAKSGAQYWTAEERIKALESRTIGVIGVDGAFFMARRCAYEPAPNDLIDDLYVSLAALTARWHVVSATDVIVHERSATGDVEELRRKARISCQALNVHKQLWPRVRRLPGPQLYGYISHRLLKWLMPFNLLGAAGCGTFLIARLLGFSPVLILAGSTAGFACLLQLQTRKVATLRAYFLALVGVGRGVVESIVLNKQYRTWNPAASIRQ